jgi:hypothetical protein
MTIRASKQATTFHMECSVSCNIQASPARVWGLLTDAPGFSRWNSTVTSIEGRIALGEKVAIRVPAAPKRVFKPTVSAFTPEREMVWSDGMAPMFKGVRTYTLASKPDGTVDFTMRETFDGVMLPMIKGSLPDFGPIFETYASDLKREAEKSAKSG